MVQEVHLLSASSGNLLEHLLTALLTQFPANTFAVRTVPFLKTEEDLKRALDAIDRGLVCHAIAHPARKAQAEEECARRQLPCLDITGPILRFLEAGAGVKAFETPRPIHRVDAGYLGRMAALEFAMQHDDSRRVDRLQEAEVVLVGLSRVSKSPTALFLAYRGFLVANVALVPAQSLPPELEHHTVPNVVGLTIQPRRLAEIRAKRFGQWELGNEFDYMDMRHVIREVMDAEAVYRGRGWPIIDTTSLAVEQTSALVLKALGLRPKEFS